MREQWQAMIGNPEPAWSFKKARDTGRELRSLAAQNPDISKRLIAAAVMVEELAHCAEYYRFRWINAARVNDGNRNPPRDAEKARHDEAQ